MRRTTARIGAALGAGVLAFSLGACAEDDDPDVIVEEEETGAPAEPGDDGATDGGTEDGTDDGELGDLGEDSESPEEGDGG